MKAAQDGLLCDNREAALVIYGDKVQYLPMIGGLLKKMRNSGQVSNVSASVVYEKDKFAYIKGDDERIEHDPYLDGDRGPLRLAYAIAWLKDGSIQREVMTRQDIEKVRAVSKAKNGPAWANWESEMWRKSVLRRLHKYLPSNAEIEQLIAHDNETYDHGMQDITPQPVSKAEGIKEKLKRNRKQIAPSEPSDIVNEVNEKVIEIAKTQVKVAAGAELLHNAQQEQPDDTAWKAWAKTFETELKKCNTTAELDAFKWKHSPKIHELAALAKIDANKKVSYDALEAKLARAAENISLTEEK
jgi:recombinational DNA repair protein RecT